MSARSIAESKLKRFLLYGSEETVYFSGCRFQYGYFLGAGLTSLRQLLNQVDKKKISAWVKFVQEEKIASHICIVPLVVSECCKLSGWKEEAFELALTVLRTDKEFLMFCKFSYEILPEIGIGPLVTKFIQEWYLRLDCWELVEIVSKRPGCYGWYHRDVIKMANVNSSFPPMGAAFAYAIGGIELMNQKYGNDVEARDVVEHLNQYEDSKSKTDTDKAVSGNGASTQNIQTTNKTLVQKKQVWNALHKNVKITTKNITVIVDCYNLSTSYCCCTPLVQADMAAAVTALYFANASANAKVLIFKGPSHQYLQRGTTLDELVNNIGTNTKECSSSREIGLYLSPKNSETLYTDLFVVIGVNINHENYMKYVQDHRRDKARAPKFAFCSLGGILNDQLKYDINILLTTGFDDNMCDIINAFSRM
ncbi:uncharacterized protein LOC106669083 [Cimex lectularius]|uniref:TROVE domain-containing protein n=1 Tax=Cimex lectularius TaxID=79782 RepID=A0A8I6S5S7_CIMLE|nr:uncharacterized protein LOC106669083 [Cimex lectularius]